MRAKLCRRYFEQQTEGDLEVFNEDTGALEFVCKTLELAWKDNKRNISCIPEGHYEVVPRFSEKYGNHLHIIDVVERSLILIHWGNYAGSVNPRTGSPDIRGCILVGKNHTDINGDGIRDITASKNTFKALMDVAPLGLVLEITQ